MSGLMELLPEQEMGIDLELEITRTSGIHGWESARNEEGMTLNRRYKEIVKHIQTPPYDKTTFLVVMGESASGKTSLAQGFDALFNSSEILRSWAISKGVDLDIQTYTFSNNAIAARAEKIIPKDEMNGYYSKESYRRMSVFEWMMMEEDCISAQGQETARIRILETSVPTAFPLIDFVKPSFYHRPIPVYGLDRCISPALTLAYDSRTRENVFFHGTKRNPKIEKVARKWRGDLNANNTSLNDIFGKKVVVQYRRMDGMIVKADDFPKDLQQRLADFLRLTINPPEGIDRSDQDLKMLLERFELGSVDELYDIFANQAGLTDKFGLNDRFMKVHSEENLGEIGFNLNYFLNDNVAFKKIAERDTSFFKLIYDLEHISLR